MQIWFGFVCKEWNLVKNCFHSTVCKFGKFKSDFVLFAKTLFGHHNYTTNANKCSAVQYVNLAKFLCELDLALLAKALLCRNK